MAQLEQQEKAEQHADMLDAHARWWALKEQGAPEADVAAAWAEAQSDFTAVHTRPKKSCATG